MVKLEEGARTRYFETEAMELEMKMLDDRACLPGVQPQETLCALVEIMWPDEFNEIAPRLNRVESLALQARLAKAVV
ncbi:hypothetical protein [Lederbergia galactosidilytica]|uniref:hypothetical protein n=1 Tax=Lederbergia galactosidilytica TaxID=217031 RepID=UPI001AE8D9CB|nr:hypothetical protein [Lederbergia galactosidilytica]